MIFTFSFYISLEIHMRFRTAIIWNGISQFGQSGITLLSTIILARMLTPDDFGLIGIVTIFIAFSQMMVDTEMGCALLRKKTVTNTDYSTLFFYNLAVSIAIYLILFFSAPLISDFYSRPPLTGIIRVISITIIIHAFRVVQRIMIFRDLKFKTYALINVFSGIISLAVAVWCAARGSGYWSLVWQQITLALCHVAFMEAYNRFIPSPVFSKKTFKYQFSFGISLFGSNTIRIIADNISTNIIAKVTNINFTGYFTQASRITNFSQNTITSVMDQCIFPMLAKIENPDVLKSTYHRLLYMITGALSIFTICIVIWANPIIELILGKEWSQASWIMRILAISIPFAAINILCRNILKTLGETKRIMLLETIKSFLLIFLLILSTLIGMKLIIWAIVAAQIIGTVMWIWVSENTFKQMI